MNGKMGNKPSGGRQISLKNYLSIQKGQININGRMRQKKSKEVLKMRPSHKKGGGRRKASGERRKGTVRCRKTVIMNPPSQ